MLGTFREMWFDRATSYANDLARPSNENLAFTAGRVILRSRGDGLEQSATSIGVEPLGRQRLGLRGEAYENIVTQGLVELVRVRVVVDRDRASGRSWVSPMPEPMVEPTAHGRDGASRR